MRNALSYYFQKNEYSPLENKSYFSNLNEEIKLFFEKGIYLVERKTKTDLSIFEKEFGYSLPNDICDYINIFWHPCISGYHSVSEYIVLFSVLKNLNDSDEETLYYRNNLITLSREWQKIGDIKKFIPIGWLNYSGGFVLYEISTGKIYIEDINADIEGAVYHKSISNSLKYLIEHLQIAR